MLRLAIALASAATAAYAQDSRSDPSKPPAAAGSNDMRPFHFDGRMNNDGNRRTTVADDNHPSSGAIVMPPKAGAPDRE